MSDTPVTSLRNIGATLGRRLASIGIVTSGDLAKVGSVRAYQLLCVEEQRRLPVCYNLYSMEAALQGCDWRMLAAEEKARLREAAGLDA